MKRNLLFLLISAVAAYAGPAKETPLDRYVKTPDPAYKYELVGTQTFGDTKFYTIDMVSQTWLTTKEIDRPEWRHWVTIIRPPKIEHTTAFLLIGGGSTSSRKPSPDKMLAEFASSTNTIVAQVHQIPNQPVVFAGETRKRTEDELIAYGWDKFLRGGDPIWLARLPMTKAVARAMDTIQAVLAKENVKVEKFVVGGASKRGWTTWTTGAVESGRVVAIVPIVIDMLNLAPSFRKHYQAYNGYSPAVKDYTDMGIMDWMGHPRFKELTGIVEPYSYRERLTMPKYVVNGVGDQYWLPDSSQFYFKDLKGVKHLRYVPNADHSLRESDAPQSINAYYHAILTGKPLPKFTWKLDPKGSIKVKATDAPTEVKVWKATNPKERDFRLARIGKAFTSEPVTGRNGAYEVKMPKPAEGWTAFFVELTYPGPGKYPLKFTTDVLVVPDTLPFAPPVGKKQVK